MASASDSSAPQVKVCLICGDKGETKLLIYCRMCRDSAVHHYCMDNFSPDDDNINWWCWDCALIDSKVEPLRQSERNSSERQNVLKTGKCWQEKLNQNLRLVEISDGINDTVESMALPTPPSVAPQTPDDATPSGAASAPEEAGQQSAAPAAAPAPPPPPSPIVPPPSARQYISLDDARSDRRFHERINAVVRGHFPHPWPCLRQVPPEHQHFWFESMKMTYWWDCDDESMFRVFHMWVGKYIRKTFSVARSSLVRPLWLANEIWLQLQAYWASEDFQQESSKNKANRAANPTASSTMYRGGSSSVGMHKRKLEAGLGRSPKQMEVFERCYKKKEDGGWSGPRAAEVAETFQKLMENHQPQSTADVGYTPAESEASVAMTERQMWLAAVGGKNKGRVFGLGSEAHFFSQTYTSPLPLPPPNPAVNDCIGRLEEIMADMMVMMREMRASSSTDGPSQPVASSIGLVQPPTAPQPPNDDEMGSLD